MKHTSLLILFILLPAAVLQGCGAILVGSAVTGAAVIHDRRSSGTILDDKNIQLKVLSSVAADGDLYNHSSLSATSYNYVLLLTGQAETAAYRDRYEAIARSTPLVRRVINEVEIGPSVTLSESTRDGYTTSKVKLELLDIDLESFDPSRVKVVTERGVVYLMGLVTQQEASAVVEKARYVSGVKRVVKIFEYI